MHSPKDSLVWTVCVAFFCCRPTAVQAAQSPVNLTVLEASSPVPCRVHLRDGAGRALHPPGRPFWKDHFVCDGQVEMRLSAGDYTYELDRGPEYFITTGKLRVVEDQPLTVTNEVRRFANLATEGWWSGELHVHRPAQDIEVLMRAEDLHVAGLQTWWNNANPWKERALPTNPIVRFDGNRFYDRMSGEDERGGGALLYFGLKQPLLVAGSAREYPPALKFLREAKRSSASAWVDIEKPFWWDVPVWLASGLVDSVGIAHNHLHRGGVLENEAWGRPRDRAKYPGPQGNGRWTQDIYYHLLNCGLRIPPSAGSASGVLPNPVGYNRLYVHPEPRSSRREEAPTSRPDDQRLLTSAATRDERLAWDDWWQGLRAGRVFVSNGPLLRCQANDRWPGEVFKSDKPLELRLDGKLDSRDPIASVELVRNGRVERITLPHGVTLSESGWFLVRAIADVTNTFRFASTGPWYVEIGSQARPVRRESAQFFLDWTRERITNLKLDDAQQRAAVLQPLLEAEKFWQRKVADAMPKTVVTGEVVDDVSDRFIPSRLYIQHADGRWFFPESSSAQGTAFRYERRNWINTNAVEFHTTLSAHPFRVALEPGRYTFTAERGKEYRSLTQQVDVATEPMKVRLALHRWINMASRGWYAGDTHVHRTLAELPNVMLAEDLNVAFPLTYWVTKAFAPPTQGDKNTDVSAGAKLISVDATHVIWPRNTEYEIFTVNGKSHTLGAVFALGHKTPFNFGAPPLTQIAGQAKFEGALLDLDKHDWPWSMALVPVMGVDLYELANNHDWRTEFGITNWSTPAPAWMGLPNEGRNGTELDWTLYTFQNYYALLNCGFRLRPTAGTANGVHPVPLGFGRVYVQLPGGFSYDAWMKRFNEGRSFVTTGPMLLAQIDSQLPGFRFTAKPGKPRRVRVEGTVLSEQPVEAVEVVVNGTVSQRLAPKAIRNRDDALEAKFQANVELSGSGWVAVRCWEPREGRRIRFAHTAPSYFDVPGHPLKPRQEEADFLVRRVQEQTVRSGEVLPPAAIAEYRKALAIYEALARSAR